MAAEAPECSSVTVSSPAHEIASQRAHIRAISLTYKKQHFGLKFLHFLYELTAVMTIISWSRKYAVAAYLKGFSDRKYR